MSSSTSAAHPIRSEAEARTTGQGLMSRLVAGLLGGLVGGVVFGIMMTVMGMLPMIAGLVGSTSPGVGWVVHLAISVFVGITFALLVGSRLARAVVAVPLGIGYGLLWWVLGPLLLLPLRMGMPVFNVSAMSLGSLAGHLVFGAVLGVVSWLALRTAAGRRGR